MTVVTLINGITSYVAQGNMSLNSL